jgi:hypothetical protein
MAPLRGTRFNSVLSSDAKECQQAFLEPLPGKVARQKGILINFYLLMCEETIDLCSNRLTPVLSSMHILCRVMCDWF